MFDIIYNEGRLSSVQDRSLEIDDDERHLPLTLSYYTDIETAGGVVEATEDVSLLARMEVEANMWAAYSQIIEMSKIRQNEGGYQGGEIEAQAISLLAKDLDPEYDVFTYSEVTTLSKSGTRSGDIILMAKDGVLSKVQAILVKIFADVMNQVKKTTISIKKMIGSYMNDIDDLKDAVKKFDAKTEGKDGNIDSSVLSILDNRFPSYGHANVNAFNDNIFAAYLGKITDQTPWGYKPSEIISNPAGWGKKSNAFLAGLPDVKVFVNKNADEKIEKNDFKCAVPYAVKGKNVSVIVVNEKNIKNVTVKLSLEGMNPGGPDVQTIGMTYDQLVSISKNAKHLLDKGYESIKQDLNKMFEAQGKSEQRAGLATSLASQYVRLYLNYVDSVLSTMTGGAKLVNAIV